MIDPRALKGLFYDVCTVIVVIVDNCSFDQLPIISEAYIKPSQTTIFAKIVDGLGNNFFCKKASL